MRKKLISTVLCGAMCVAMFTGCGNTGKQASSDKGKGSKEPVTISYACWDSNQANLIQTMADEFEKENPDIKIDIQVNGWADYWTGLEAAATGGSLPDTFWMHSNNIYYYGSNDQLLDLSKYIDSSDKVDLANYPEGLSKIYNIDGKQYAIPKDYDTIALWYNKKMFDEAKLSYPDDTWTWEDLKEAAKKLTKDDGSQYGFCAGLHNQEGYYNFVYQNGGEIITPEKTSGYAEDKTIAGIEEYFSFVKEGLSPEIYDDAARGEAISNGLCAMGLFGSWNLSGFADSDYMKENFDCTVLPMSDDGGKASIFNGLGNAIAKTTKHPDEAWKWVEFLSSKEGQERQADLGIAISAYNGTADKFTNAYSMFNTKCYIDMVDYAQIRPYSNQTSVWEDKAYELLKNAYAGKEDTKDACKKVADMMDEAIKAE
ncbi:ABC transporter substrate-binding protein [[Clostridium] polysaccharolyticum]|uniref:Carbohydrate ABC transporter substrate-binding protein, CUT1 family (TC 3.A.1.1.-) n=1 Tax=[Clostridium] polysaccharolyticum TaxID=29364 RepID=A0A1I0CGR8_9FIRM|nr:sugar ABC transporter substrate-binding protein [[Clostridium] polysaccharolyticum]SET18770.1 carbohydrate ABC transporter substrate-binding protein, CUT1 family (TC 3.A.1.1.-) [[Clostridium] polysaccharolyticum]